jgi:hypothetical protein
MTEHQQNTEAPLCDACRMIPLSHLALDVAEPVVGWKRFFEERNVIVMDDHLGRPSVARYVLGDLIAEQREARPTEHPRPESTPVPVGVPAKEGLSAIETMMAQSDYTSLHAELGRPKPNFLEEQFEEGRRHAAEQAEAVRRVKEKLAGGDE